MLHLLRDLFASFERHEVKYLVIGGIAAVLHGVPRATFDLDILIQASPENAARLLQAMLEAGLGTAAGISAEDPLANEITIFMDRIRLDVQTLTPGVSFDRAWPRRKDLTYRKQTIHVLSRQDLIASKKAAGRFVDLQDVEQLELGSDDPA